ncbi:Stk1 family PASTA domain-containing Ser/Thr kinase [Aerococcaceae bacterium DSM 111020]|nr:Stk1 family PASTA domain-containing Ser/Thr kinase [Aerococcaceae bacterium DSM 111020]
MVELGEKLSSRYKIIRPIGQGGMANVFLADDLILDRQVAVKLLRFDFQDDQDAIRRFQREAMSASQLLHHNIVEVYDVDEEDGQQYIVMEYVDGTDLKTFIREKSPISLELTVNIMSQILSAIDLAHRSNLIHRDIKPQNILLTKDNKAKITDFGIAVALTDTSITQTNTLLGSVHYLSPEQARGNNATTKSDIYALGVVLYELITGSVPYDGESAVSVALKHFQEPFPKIREQLDYVPQSLENVVLKATAKEPNDRYETVQDMLQDLSTSLSASRMNEPIFVPSSEAEETMVLRPIQPTKQVHNQKIAEEQPGKPEALDDEIYNTYDTVYPVNKTEKSRRWLKTLLAFLVLFLLGAAAVFGYNTFIRYTTIPDVSGMTQDEAINALREENLEIGEITPNWDESTPEGNAINTSPSTGTRVERDSAVDLIVSRGKQQVVVDDYTGESYERIRRLLTDADFIVERRDMWTDDPSLEGVILGQSIPAGTELVPSQSAITLTVGSSASSSNMQDFYNLSLDMVYNFAVGFGLTVEETYAYNDYIPEGQIISQDPEPGTPLTPGDTITVEVSQGPEEAEVQSVTEEVYVEYVPTYAPSDVNENNPLPNNIQVFISDSRNNINEVAEEFEITESQTVRIQLYIPSNAIGQYRVLNNGEVVAESNEVYP